MKKSRFSRRRFLTVGSVSLAGVWTAFSDSLGARAVRGFVAESRRGILQPTSIPKPETWDPNAITASWLGHSTVLLNFYGVTILTDPVLVRNIGADLFMGTVGPKRFVAPALRRHELPAVDLVLLSHAHMDHLNCATLRWFPNTTRAVTARGTADLLKDTRLKEPTELGWGEQTRVTTANGDVDIQAFEVKHWGARWRYDRHRGYNGYVIEREGKRIIFGGDTAWTDSFRSLRSRKPFEFAMMPIGAYKPWIESHCTPEEAAEMARDAGAERLLPMHFKTFALGREGIVEPMERLHGAMDAQCIGWREIGETFVA